MSANPRRVKARRAVPALEIPVRAQRHGTMLLPCSSAFSIPSYHNHISSSLVIHNLSFSIDETF
jgi:hypothetical protein